MEQIADIESIINHIKALIAEETHTTPDDINIDGTFHALGMDSISSVFIMEEMEKEYKVTITPICFWDYPTIRLLASYVHTLV